MAKINVIIALHCIVEFVVALYIKRLQARQDDIDGQCKENNKNIKQARFALVWLHLPINIIYMVITITNNDSNMYSWCLTVKKI